MKYLFVLFIVLYFGISCISQTLLGKVVGISDGDTFTMLSAEKKPTKIRLHGIDCPERGQDFYNVAKQRLSNLIYLKVVNVEVLNVDYYGRTIGMVLINGRNVNEILLNDGLAWQFIRYDRNPKWHELQFQAQQKKIGLWSASNPIPPWQFRKLKRFSKKSTIPK